VFPWLTVQQNLIFGLKGNGHGDKGALAKHYAAMVGLKGFEALFVEDALQFGSHAQAHQRVESREWLVHVQNLRLYDQSAPPRA
jgi:ABC-type nitrate/sulfonate/bicarbonate transport system ATPase subunit